MNRSQSKIRHIQEANSALERRTLLKEDEQSVSALNAINQELSSIGFPSLSMDDFNSEELPSKWVEMDTKLNQGENQDNEQKTTTLSKIKEAMCAASPEELKAAKKQLIGIIGNKLNRIKNAIKGIFKGKKQEPAVNESAELMATTTLLGVSAPLWVFIAIGAVVLFLICKFILFPKRDGYGCRGNYTWKQMIYKNTRP